MHSPLVLQNYKPNLRIKISALVTQAKKEPPSEPTTEDDVGGTRRSKREPYTIAAWRLTKKEDKVCMHGKDYFWCTGDHWSSGTKHNEMNTDHKTCNHESWRSHMDERRKGHYSQSKETSSKPAEASSQKLALNDKLQNAFCTQAGLSAEAIDRIWQDAQGTE